MTSASGPELFPVSAKIAELRKQVDAVDSALLALLKKRAELTLKIGMEKRKETAAVLVRKREKQVLARVRKRASRLLGPKTTERIFKEIISACRRVQR